MPIIFDGRSFAQQKEKELIRKVCAIAKTIKRNPKLVTVSIGKEKDVAMYISMKEKIAKRLGVDFARKMFPDGIDEREILSYVAGKNKDRSVDGILLELPIPRKYSVTSIMEQISPQKDPDCMTYENLGRVLYGEPRLLPATVMAIKDIIFSLAGDSASVVRGFFSLFSKKTPPATGALAGPAKLLAYKNAVVIGGGIELGKPLAMILSNLGAAVSLCRSTTRDLSEFTKNADIIVSAVGKPNLVTGNMIKERVVIIDAGISFINGKPAGDIDFESVSKKASFITPVPGGVGPVTIISLFENLIELCYK